MGYLWTFYANKKTKKMCVWRHVTVELMCISPCRATVHISLPGPKHKTYMGHFWAFYANNTKKKCGGM